MFEIEVDNSTNFDDDSTYRLHPIKLSPHYQLPRQDHPQRDYQTFILEVIAHKLSPGNLEFSAFREQLRSTFNAI